MTTITPKDKALIPGKPAHIPRNKALPFPLLDVWLPFHVLGAVVPGQPIPVEWEIVVGELSGAPDVGTVVSAAILLNGNEIWRRDHITLSAGDSGIQHDSVIPNQQTASIVYATGHKTLQLQVIGNGKDPGPYEAEARLLVRRESVDSWWQWTHPTAGLVVDWKASYTLSGLLNNQSAYDTMTTVSAHLNETTNGDPAVPRGDVNPGTLNPGASAPASFPSITQDWEWIVPHVWVVKGPTEKNFDYVVSYQFADPFGNSYGQDSGDVGVYVAVSLSKVGAGGAASGAMASAIAFAAAAAAAAASLIGNLGPSEVLAGIAAGFYVAADAAGGLAQDPPAPDPLYRERVRLRTATVTKRFESEKGSGLSSIRSFVEAVNRVFAAGLALSQVQGRLTTSKYFADAGAIEMHTSEYRQIESRLLADALKLPELVRSAQRCLEKNDSQPRLVEQLQEWHRGGLSDGDRRSLEHAGLPEVALSAIATAIRDPNVYAAAKDLTSTMEQLAFATQMSARAIQREAPTALGSSDPRS